MATRNTKRHEEKLFVLWLFVFFVASLIIPDLPTRESDTKGINSGNVQDGVDAAARLCNDRQAQLVIP